MNTCPEHMIPACGQGELDAITSNRERVKRLPGEKLSACKQVVLDDIGLRPGNVYEDMCRKLGDSLSVLVRQGAISTRHTLHRDASKIQISLPVSMLNNAGFASEQQHLYISRNELYEKPLVDLAGIVYQTTLMLQIDNPSAFPSDHGLCPTNTLRIMPYSMVDITAMSTWICQFQKLQWLTVTPLGEECMRPGVPRDKKQVSYHCTGCKNFYRDLFANHVPVDRVFAHVYGPDKLRRIGCCVNERPWLPTKVELP